ncbi:BMP family ABC transporter substrate-binding protein [Acidimangrovimonas pyrenivorans]|uniref:BMP family ABC transporter substrate-binding protein n=1 Tax=Acidimangrovimonas pyrenivorans TaxID=2030798 RepID=A0ABV7AN69_9RHOB
MKRRTFLANTAVAGAAMASGLASRAMAADPLKVGFIYVGVPGDGGWTYQHDQARQDLEKHFDGAVKTSVIENVPEGADAERALTQLALAGNKLIYATSFGFMDAVISVAKKFPQVKFEHATGYKLAPNVSTYSARFYEGRTVIGTIAGRMTKSNKIGYIASFPIPEVIRGINAAYIAAKKVNPDVEIKVVWAYTWFDPAKEADAAQALIDEGVDVLLQHTDSTAPMAKAKDAGIIAFGQASDMAQYKPTPRVSAIIDNWGPYYIERTQAVIDGSWKSKNSWYGIDEGMVKIGEITDAVPAEVKAEALKVKDEIASGALKPFTGPLNKQDGSVWLKDGESADDGTLAGLNFYVEGIKGDIPK